MFSLLMILIAITHIFDLQTAPLIDSGRLPGLDEVESGFDVATMLSASDKESKFRIFDLSDKGPNPFKVNAAGKERIYNTPLHAQVTDVSTRREVNCEDLSNSYTQFYSSYFRSTRSSSGWSFFFLRGTTQRHETLKKIYDAMSKNSQAVGTSTSWWGLYSIQLGPPFILRFDPMFNASLTNLVSLPIPTNEAEQTPYNMLLETYGTHYVTHVIVGATAHMYTLVNESYSKTSTYEEITTQVSRMGSFWFFGRSSQEQTHSVSQSISESFRKNSNSFAVYQPPVASIVGKTEWQSWLANAPLQPVVVNRTLAPLSNLFYGYPKVQAHLKRTIEYYTTKGNLPNLV